MKWLEVLAVAVGLGICMAIACTFYVLYWTAWCWTWLYAWPSGPQWFVQPSLWGFSTACFTTVIITLMILNPEK